MLCLQDTTYLSRLTSTASKHFSEFFLRFLSQMCPPPQRNVPFPSPFSLFTPYSAIQTPAQGIQQSSTVLSLASLLGLVKQVVPTKSILLFSLIVHEHEKAEVTSCRKHFYILHSLLPRRYTGNNFPLLKKATFPNFLSVGSSSAKQWRIYTGDATQSINKSVSYSTPKSLSISSACHTYPQVTGQDPQNQDINFNKYFHIKESGKEPGTSANRMNTQYKPSSPLWLSCLWKLASQQVIYISCSFIF